MLLRPASWILLGGAILAVVVSAALPWWRVGSDYVVSCGLLRQTRACPPTAIPAGAVAMPGGGFVQQQEFGPGTEALFCLAGLAVGIVIVAWTVRMRARWPFAVLGGLASVAAAVAAVAVSRPGATPWFQFSTGAEYGQLIPFVAAGFCVVAVVLGLLSRKEDAQVTMHSLGGYPIP